MLKAAETTQRPQANALRHSECSRSLEHGSIVVPGQSQTSFVDNPAYTTSTPAMAYNYIEPGQDTNIRVLGAKTGLKMFRPRLRHTCGLSGYRWGRTRAPMEGALQTACGEI